MLILDPDDYYGWEKLFTEKMCESYRRDHDLGIKIARFHNIYGPEGTYDGGEKNHQQHSVVRSHKLLTREKLKYGAMESKADHIVILKIVSMESAC